MKHANLPNGTSGTWGVTSAGFSDVAKGVCGPFTRTFLFYFKSEINNDLEEK